MKRILVTVLILSLLLPASGLAFNEAGYPICDEPITITLAGTNSGTEDWNDTNMVAEVEKRLGIKLDCTSFNGDAWPSQFTLMLAGETLPDIVVNPGINLEEVGNYGAQGYFLDMAPYIDQYAPNIQAFMKEYPLYRNYITSPDGGIYTLLTISPNIVALFARNWINKNWLENVGMEYPKTVEDLHQVLLAFKEKDANGNGDPTDEIPMFNVDGEYMFSTLLHAFGFTTRSTEYLLQADENGKVYLGETTDAFKAYLKYMNTLYNEGLLGDDFYTRDNATASSYVAEDRVGAFGAPAPFVRAGKDIAYDSNFYYLGALTSEYNGTPTIVLNSAIYTTPEILVNADIQYPAEIVRLLDYYYSEEGIFAGGHGYEGIDWDWVDIGIEGLEGSKILQMRCPEGYSSAEEYRYKKAVINEAFKQVVALKGTVWDIALNATPEQLELLLPANGWGIQFIRQGLNREDVVLVDRFPTLLYNAEEANERTQLYTDIKMYLSNMQSQFITGQASIEDDWDTFLAQLDAMNLTRLLEIEQGAYDRLMGV